MSAYQERLELLLEDLDVFDDWTERYEYIISLGRKLAPLPEQFRVDENLIVGCQSRVWVGFEMQDGVMQIYADSDSLITKGLIALFVRLLSNLPPAEVSAADLSALDESGLREHLASTRANALRTMAQTIQRAAASFL